MSPALAGDERRGEDRDRHLHDEDQRRHLRRGPALQGGHLADQGQARGRAGRQRPGDGHRPPIGADRVSHELGRQATPREGGAGGERRGDATGGTAPQRIGGEREGSKDRQRRGERHAAGVVRRGIGRDARQAGDADDDRDHGGDVARVDALTEPARGQDEQQDQPEREPGLHDSEGREQQRSRLQRPPGEPQRGARQPARPARQPPDERCAQAVLAGDSPRLERLQRDPGVVERGRRARGAGTEDDRGHGPGAP